MSFTVDIELFILGAAALGLTIFGAGYACGIVDATEGRTEDQCEKTIIDLPWRMIRRMRRSTRRQS